MLTGDPVYRKIELDAPIGSTHQDAKRAVRNLSYVARRFGGPRSASPNSDQRAELGKLRRHLEELRISKRNPNVDPFSKEYPGGGPVRTRNSKRGAYMGIFRKKREGVSRFPVFTAPPQ